MMRKVKVSKKLFNENCHGDQSNGARSKLLSLLGASSKRQHLTYYTRRGSAPLCRRRDMNGFLNDTRILTYINVKGLEWISRAKLSLFFSLILVAVLCLETLIIICSSKLLFVGFCVHGWRFCDLNCQFSWIAGYYGHVYIMMKDKEGRDEREKKEITKIPALKRG